MDFSKEILREIELLGADGYDFAMIAKALNMTSSDLQEEQSKNPKLKTALDKAAFNADMLLLSQIRRNSHNLKSPVQLELLKILLTKHDNNTDNEIIIRRV